MTNKKDPQEIIVDDVVLADVISRLQTAEKQLELFSKARQEHASKLEEIDNQMLMLQGFRQAYHEMYFKMSGGKKYNPSEHSPVVSKIAPTQTEAE